MIVNKSTACDIFGCTRMQLDAFIREGMPVKERPKGRGQDFKLDTVAMFKWFQQQLTGERPLKAEEERARLFKEQADREEMANMARRQELLPAGEIRSSMMVMVGNLRDRLLLVPGNAAAGCIEVAGEGPVAVAEVITEHLHEALADISEAEIVGVEEAEAA